MMPFRTKMRFGRLIDVKFASSPVRQRCRERAVSGDRCAEQNDLGAKLSFEYLFKQLCCFLAFPV